MRIGDLIKDIKQLRCEGSVDTPVTGIGQDSRKVVPGTLFIAVRGTAADGHRFMDAAAESGAVCIVCEELPAVLRDGVTYVVTDDTREALGHIASAWYGYPSSALTLVGVTGTNGKTTVATLLYEMFRLQGEKVGLLSTVCNYIDDKPVAATHTTPDAITLNALLADMVKAGCSYAFMEVSSHSADQKRIAGLDFDGGIFTNLTRDHMDYHKTTEAYLKAKKSFFDSLGRDAFALVNSDDKNGSVMVQNCKGEVHTYSLSSAADFKGKIIESRLDGTLISVNGREVETLFVGRFNAYNLLAVYGAAVLLGMAPDTALVRLSMLVPVSGRFQTLRSSGGLTAVIDYAHTPDAVTNVLNSIKEVIGGKGRVITVVGAGGNRDTGKRPIMAAEAARLSDMVILTSDNPRFEDPDDIIAQMRAGLSPQMSKKVLSVTDRREAIRTALRLAQPGDVVLVAGKGHEDYQEIKGVKHHFNDREVVEEAFNELTC